MQKMQNNIKREEKYENMIVKKKVKWKKSR